MNVIAAPPPIAQSTAATEKNQQTTRDLAATDRRVRAHEAAHLAAAGGLARGGATFSYQRGPDNRQYAIAGEVQIDASTVPGNPQATLRKAQQIQRAALAPADPSAQDRAVAAAAVRMAVEARAELAAQPEPDGSSPDRENPETSSNLKQTGELTCPACGGAHAGHVHDGVTAYQSIAEPERAGDQELQKRIRIG